MTKLFGRIGVWAVITLAIASVSLFVVFPWLYAKRNPTEAVAESYIRQQLGNTLKPGDEAAVRNAIASDPLLAMLVVRTSQEQGTDPFKSLAQLPRESTTPQNSVKRLALDAAFRGQLNKKQAADFVYSTLALWALLNDIDPTEAERFLDTTQHLSDEEYLNAASDASYALLVARVNPRHRGTLQDNQETLTPLLAMADPTEWDGLLDRFEKAQPRVGKILTDPKLGRTYGLIYMLHFEAIIQLVGAGLSEKEAIDFAGVNGAAIRSVVATWPQWSNWVARLQHEAGPTNRSVFEAACADPAVFWLVCHDGSADHEESLIILRRYAGTELPAILLKYREQQKLLDPAMESLVRFDNENDSNKDRRGAAAHFLSKYQDDEAFKVALIKHGAVLIPALSAGGPDDLAKICANPNEINKWVNEDGSLRTMPLWTYIPGGNIVYAVREKFVEGRTLTWGELGWAAVDIAFLAPLAGEAALGVKALVAGERTAGEAIVEASARTGGKAFAKRIVAKAGGQLVMEEAEQSAVRLAAAVESESLLAAGGRKLAQGTVTTLRTVLEIAKSHPIFTSAVSVVVLAAIFPEKASQICEKLRKALVDASRGASSTLGNMMAAVPGGVIDGLLGEVQSLVAKQPWLAPVYYTLLAVLVLANLALAVYLLKKIVRPVYEWLVVPAMSALRGSVARLWPRKRLAASRGKIDG